MIGWESTYILPQCECTQLGASQVQLWVAARGHGNLWICLWFASQADPSLIYEDINLLQSCQVGVRTSYSQVAPYNCSCWAFESRMAWILPRVLVWRLEETFQPHLALCSCVLQWTEWLPGLQVDRGKKWSPETCTRADKCLLLSNLDCIWLSPLLQLEGWSSKYSECLIPAL